MTPSVLISLYYTDKKRDRQVPFYPFWWIRNDVRYQNQVGLHHWLLP